MENRDIGFRAYSTTVKAFHISRKDTIQPAHRQNEDIEKPLLLPKYLYNYYFLS